MERKRVLRRWHPLTQALRTPQCADAPASPSPQQLLQHLYVDVPVACQVMVLVPLNINDALCSLILLRKQHVHPPPAVLS